MWFNSGGARKDRLASIRQDMALESLLRAGASRRGAALLISAGYTSASAFRKAPWTAEEAGDLHSSAEWRLRMAAGSTASLLAEVRAFRDEFAASALAGETAEPAEGPLNLAPLGGDVHAWA